MSGRQGLGMGRGACGHKGGVGEGLVVMIQLNILVVVVCAQRYTYDKIA